MKRSGYALHPSPVTRANAGMGVRRNDKAGPGNTKEEK